MTAEGILGTLVSDGGLRLALTRDDATWMARACVGESVRDAAEVTSTLLRRWAFVNDQRTGRGESTVWPTLTDLIRAYSQPVNPRWAERGTAARQARRARISSMAWSDVPATVRTTVLELLGGRRRLALPGAVHFADRRVSASFLARYPAATRVRASTDNVFIALPASRSYPEPVILPGPGAPPASPSDGGAVASGAAVALALVVAL